jgi:hypothetical protein
MAQEDVPLKELKTTRERLVYLVNSSLTESERRFLITFKRRPPDWSLLGLEGVERLPATAKLVDAVDCQTQMGLVIDKFLKQHRLLLQPMRKTSLLFLRIKLT